MGKLVIWFDCLESTWISLMTIGSLLGFFVQTLKFVGTPKGRAKQNTANLGCNKDALIF